MKKYFMEIYFRHDMSPGLDIKPILSDYRPNATPVDTVAVNWDEAKDKVLSNYPNTAFMLVHRSEALV